MGGFGSGRQPYGRRPHVSECPAIPAKLVRQQLEALQAGGTGRMTWSIKGEPVLLGELRKEGGGAISVICSAPGGEKGGRAAGAFMTAWDRCRFGGRRLRLICPVCGRKADALYIRSRVACRKCCSLGYFTESLDSLGRARERAEKIKEKLGGNPFSRPQGMRESTYRRIWRSYVDAVDKRDRIAEDMLRKFVKSRLDP